MAALGLLGLGGVLALVLRRPEPSSEQLLAELERALHRAGRSIGQGVTLAGLEQRFRSAPDAAGYIRMLRLHRFAGASALPTAKQRRALRAALGAGLGPLGRLRALWALPPRIGSLTPHGARPHGA